MPKTTNLPTPPDIRDGVQSLATEKGLTFKSMILVLLRQALAAEAKRK